ncbi:hypothetical protein [Flavobacterium cyclinae]|uniref:hypothetical protein n=1 Tax=Flavobacterium cyclinae TaxID=2895947 RepID=UPI001E62D6AC|nr:hypothetical protein [Flavobacterium cyclinae]UGS21141.1 hypothetical protein LOS86_00515 [Flavobacterium cyclinae]
MKVYKIDKVWRIITCVLTPVAMIPFGVLLLFPIIPDFNFDINKDVYYWFLLPLSVTMLFVIIVAFVNTIIGKFVIDKNKIYTTGLFNNKQIYFNDIKGYRITEHFTFIESISNKTRIKLSNYYENRNELHDWLIWNYKNLNELEIIQEKQEILSKQDLGWTIEERESKFLKYKRLAKILNWSGGIIAIGTTLLLKTSDYIILLCIVYPIFCLLAILFSKGLLTLDERNEAVYPSVFWAFFAPTSVIFLRALMYFKIYNYDNVWLLTAVIAFSFFFTLIINNRGFVFNKFERTSTILIFSVFIVFGYSFGTVINLNYALDDSQPKKFKTIVLDKRITKGKSTNYYLTVSPWNNQKEPKEENTNESDYEIIKKGDTITINFYEGKLNIPWYEIKLE